MQNSSEEKKETIRPTTPQAIEIAKALLRTARFGALACISASTNRPNASRVALATDNDGTPLILVSALAPHTASIIAHPHCSILVGEPGKGDAMAYARATIHCTAKQFSRDNEAYSRLRTRYLNHNPKGALYVDLGDFSFFRLEIDGASLNGGFGKAFNLTTDDLLCETNASHAIAIAEADSLHHLNHNYKEQITKLGTNISKSVTNANGWSISAIDPNGFNLRSNETIERVWFKTDVSTIEAAKAQILTTLDL